MDTAKWPQEIVMKAMEETTIATKPSLERKMMRPQREEAVNCPRCNSTNTKFCYYNNYSLSQPRYFCKTCRRYWTEGGSLRNIPVGGGSRKNRINIRASSSSSSSSNNSSSVSNSKKIPAASDPSKIHCHDTQELNLGFPNSTKNDQFRAINELIQVPNFDISSSSSTTSSSSPSSQALASSHGQLSAMELLTGISTTSVGLNSFHVPMLAANYSTTGFSSLPQHDHQFKLNFSLDGTDNSTPAAAAAGGTYGSSTFPETNNNGKVRFPFEDLKQVENNTTDHNQDAQKNRDDHQHGYWSGIIGGGSWEFDRCGVLALPEEPANSY